MSIPKDFRTITKFNTQAIKRNGEYIGKNDYWKLYSVENLYRIIIHSILSVQISRPPKTDWWIYGTDVNIQSRATNFKNNYIKKFIYTKPGVHEIYYIFLSDLNEIVRANINLFYPIIKDIDKWIVKIEDINLPRNVVAHMNFLNVTDHNRIDTIYCDMLALFDSLFIKPSLPTPIPLNVPK